MDKDQKLAFEIDGEGVSPETIDPAMFLSLAAKYFEFIKKLAEEESPLSFSGIWISKKCVQVSALVNDPFVARATASRAFAIVAGQEPAPKGTEALARQLQRELRALPPHMNAGYLAPGKTPVRFNLPTQSQASGPNELVELRVVPIGVGGKMPKATFYSESEKSVFSLGITQAQARILGKLLYLEVDIEASVARDLNGEIDSGEVSIIHELSEASPGDAWRAWYRGAAADWDNVADIEAELDRSH